MNGNTGTSTDDGTELAAIETGDGDTVIYDRSNSEAWIQSSDTVEVEA